MLNEDIKEIKVSNPPVTTFKEFKGSFKAVNSIFNSRDLVVLGESFKILGNSEINLKDQTIQADFEAGGVETRNFIIPIKITGKITTPKISLNTAILLKETVKQFASQTARLIDGKWSGQLGNLLGDFASKLM